MQLKIQKLLDAINNNIEQINVGFSTGQDEYVPMVRLQYIIDEMADVVIKDLQEEQIKDDDGLIIIDNFDNLPANIREEVHTALTLDILNRYDNSSYHNEDVIHNTLQDHGYKLKD